MKDILEKRGNSFLQHGKYNDRIYVLKSDEKNYNDFMETIGTEKSEYIDWINKFLDYIPNE